MILLDQTGQELIVASAYSRILHDEGNESVRKLQSSLARACMAYARKQGGMQHEMLLNQMADAIVAKVDEIRRA